MEDQMSTLVLTNDSLVFGPQSPLYRGMTESGIKDNLVRLISDKNSQVIRKRSFATYVLANKVFPRNEINISEYVKYGIGQLIDPFVGYSVKGSIDSVNNVKRNQYQQGEVTLINELAKATKIKNMLVMVVDSTKDTYINQKGITTYITKSIAGDDNPVEAVWENNFFTFGGAASLSMVVIIPKSYIGNLMVNIQASNAPEINNAQSINRVVFRSIMVDAFAIDLIKSIFTALYSDGYRSRINRDIGALNELFQKEGGNILTGTYGDTNQDSDSVIEELRKYSSLLKGFKNGDCENLVYEMIKFIRYRSSVYINPYEFYSTFVDIPYEQMEYIFAKIPALCQLSSQSRSINQFDFSNSLKGMNTFFNDNDRDVLVYGLKLVRFIPFLLFNTYVIGGGADHNGVQTILKNIKSFMNTIGSFRSRSIIYAPVGNFIISELDYILNTLAPQFSSPMAVNEKSRSLIASSIIAINRAVQKEKDTDGDIDYSGYDDSGDAGESQEL